MKKRFQTKWNKVMLYCMCIFERRERICRYWYRTS